ncbi:MAG TPA: TIR domain-containing protein [Longimicrobiaceae bacterium]|nr:TIR domain-containing protein [Longimicrobiaceae bacterium]
MIGRHRVFISYHDGRGQPSGGDWQYRYEFERLFHLQAEVLVSGAVQDGDIDPGLPVETTRRLIRDKYLRDTSVTVVLVGARTWQRKHVDWEIGSSLRDTEYNPRSGLIGILLPSYPGYPNSYDPHTIPPRLNDNVVCGYAKLYRWTPNPEHIRTWVHEAYLRRKQVLPVNSRDQFVNNRSGDRWND